MNDKSGQNQDSYRELLLMSELEAGSTISQREIARRLGIAVGLVNNYLKKLVSKGFVSVKTFPRNRYAYLLTPQGLTEKSRLAFQQVGFFHEIFKTVRENSLKLFLRLKADGVNEVVFCGVDEFTEIAYLSLCEAGLVLKGVVDDQPSGKVFLGHNIQGLNNNQFAFDENHIVITSFRKTEELRDMFLEKGFSSDKINVITTPL